MFSHLICKDKLEKTEMQDQALIEIQCKIFLEFRG